MIDGSHPSHPSHSSHSSSSDDRIRRKIEALGNSLSLPTVRKALGVLEGEHASNRRGGNDDPMDIRVYGPGDEARLIDWKASARLGRPMVVQHARQAIGAEQRKLIGKRVRRAGLRARRQRAAHVRRAVAAAQR